MSIRKGTRTRLIWREGKKVRAHRWIIEQKIGRKLLPNEQVHHINGDPLDNRIENLTILSPKEHMCLHKQIYPDKKICTVCGNGFQPNPRKRKRQKCCSSGCAQSIRLAAMWKSRGINMSSRKSRNGSGSKS